MRVGMIGLGKLGLPVATAMASRGLEVFGFDPQVTGYPEDPSYEENFAKTIKAAEDRLHFCGTVAEVVANSTVVFCAVQTPHEQRFEGITPLPDDRADFDYSHLVTAVQQVNAQAQGQQRHITLAIISTVLPGTMTREVEPLLSEYVSLAYNPSFIAMGTTIRDFLDPEFILTGGDGYGKVREVYLRSVVEPCQTQLGGGPCNRGGIGCPLEHAQIYPPQFYSTSIPNAELIKVAYNTFIGLKLAFANTLMEVCHKTNCDVDEVTGALKLAHRRLISGAYLDGGMGDGGGCHPRDNIALSWLARELDLSYDLFGAAMEQREAQAAWLADMMLDKAGDLPLGILGIAYKPSSHIVTGSPAVLVMNLLRERGQVPFVFDPHVPDFTPRVNAPVSHPRLWLVGCKHPEFAEFLFPKGSVVIDPWRYIPDQPGVEVIRLGERSTPDDGPARQSGELRQAA